MPRVILLTTILVFSYCRLAVAQSPQDCIGAIPVCSNFYNEPTGYGDFGDIDDLFNINGCLINGENNSVWYIFTVSNSGTLEMELVPAAGGDDYDFAIYDLSSASCQDIVDGNLPPIRCNFSATPGAPTGMRAGFTSTSAGVSGDAFLAPMNVTANETYVLLVDNYTNSSLGYTLDFSGGTANIIDNIPPTLESVSTLTCDTTSIITIRMSEPVQCSTILADGSQFSITGPQQGIDIIGAYGSAECDSSEYTQVIHIQIDSVLLAEGIYTVTIMDGTGGQAILDICDNPAVDGDTVQFDAPAIVLPDFAYIVRSSCFADTVIFFNISRPATFNGNPTYTWDFNDGSPVSNAVDPVHVFPDSIATVTLTATTLDGCTYSFDSTFQIIPGFTAAFGWQPSYGCPNEPIQFTDTSQGAADTWLWGFGDGGISGQQNPTHTYTVPGDYQVTLTISQTDGVNSCSDSIIQTVTINDQVFADFSVDQSQLCSGIPFQFTDESSGNPQNWTWSFGNDSSSTEQNPSYVYDTTGIFDVQLLVDNGCGADSITQTFSVNEVPVFDLGQDTSVCFEEPVVLIAYPGAGQTQWSTGETGDSITVTNPPAEIRVTVTNDGCEYSDLINIYESEDGCIILPLPSAFSPNGDGNNDFFRTINPERVEDLEVWIYNRWGELVFHDNKLTFEWDGTYKGDLQDVGVFTWYVQGFGLSSRGRVPFYRSGNLTLVR